MQETIRERKKAVKLSPEEARAQGEADVQAKIAEMAADDRGRSQGMNAPPCRTS
jgi:hypothetical protein